MQFLMPRPMRALCFVLLHRSFRSWGGHRGKFRRTYLRPSWFAIFQNTISNCVEIVLGIMKNIPWPLCWFVVVDFTLCEKLTC